MHIWWSRPIAQTFQKEIFIYASKMFVVPVQPNPTTALLNLKPDCLTHAQFKLFLYLLTAAKQTLAKAWKTPSLAITETKQRMNNDMIHPKMEAIEHNQVPKFHKLWQPWIKHYLPLSFNDSVLMPW